MPKLASDPEIIVELAIAEFESRADGDTIPSIDEYTSRFSDIGQSLRSRLEQVAFATRVSDTEYQGRMSDST
ncbi:MAG: hypothetical protein AB8B91_08805 [Rubripirellula sp.]